jgi:PHD/YefM family antitoxin component YafN of YafNO toxin-antitoxin module
MLEVPATEVAKRFSQYCQAAQREPVAVTHHRRVTEVLVSKRDYDEYVRLKSMATRSLWLHELSADSLAALAEARVDPRHNHLDALLFE